MSDIVRSGRKKLTTKQERALEALLQGNSQRDSAEIAGITPRTLRRWCREDEQFIAELELRSHSLLSRATIQLGGALEMSADLLRAVLSNEDLPVSIRIRSANLIFRNYFKFFELQSIDQRIARIEALLIEE